ncbi:serine/threonine protein kinase [bacterium]|nr:serine/threonine protein kinase [bacterium]
MKHLNQTQLSELLDLECEGPAADVERHLETCNRCQQRLSDLAAEGDEWKQTAEFLSSAEWNPNNFDPARFATQVQIETDGEVKSPVVPLTFLEDPRHPELLGRLGKYDIESVIGQGGMGVVLKGFDPDLNRPVAIKVMAPWLASSGTPRKRFAREARAAAAVVHKHVVAIHGIETDGELPYLVMEYVAGESLQQYIDRNGPLDTNEILRITSQVASGLAAAHDQGLVHRDVKPANILLHSHVGRVQITDFGLARAADDAAMTCSGIIAGTPHYMSPEQAGGRGIDVRSDLFSLGSTIYLMATGRLPFNADGPMAVLQRICNEVPIPIRELNPEIPQHLSDIVEKLLSKVPEQRFQSAEEVKVATKLFLAHRQNPLKNAQPAKIQLHRAADVVRRKRMLLLVVACLLPVAWFAAQWLTTTPVDTAANRQTASTTGMPVDSIQSANEQRSPIADLQLLPFEELDARLSSIRQQVDLVSSEPFEPTMPGDNWSTRVHEVDSQLQQLESEFFQPHLTPPR